MQFIYNSNIDLSLSLSKNLNTEGSIIKKVLYAYAVYIQMSFFSL